MSDPGLTPTIDDLLEHTDWLRRLARQLAGSEIGEDLVQDAWVTSLRSPPRHGEQVRAWLRRVVHNAFLQRLRRDERRAQREQRAARPIELPSALTLVERAEEQRRLVDAVLAMPEPSRSLLLLRYFEGRSPARIAAEQGAPLETVKTRLRRALIELRRRVRGRESQPRAKTSRRRPAYAMLGSAGLASAARASIWTGVLSMTSKTKMFAGALGLVVLGLAVHEWWPTSPAPNTADVGDLALLDAQRDESGQVAIGSDTERLEDAKAGALGAKPGPRLRGVLRGLVASAPWTSSIRFEVGTKSALRVGVERDGTFEVDMRHLETPGSVIRVRGDDPRYLSFERELRRADLSPSRDDPLVIRVAAASVLSGVVQDVAARGLALARVAVFADRARGPASVPVVEGRCDENGRYALKTSYVGRCHVVAAEHEAWREDDSHEQRRSRLVARTQRAVARAAAIVAVPLIVLEPGVEIRGEVRGPNGRVMPGVTVRAEGRGDLRVLNAEGIDWLWWSDGQLIDGELSTRSDARGQFVFHGLPKHGFELSLAWIDASISFLPPLQRVVRAPAHGISLQVRAARLAIAVPNGLGSAAHVAVRKGRRLHKGSMPASGTMPLWLEAGQRYRIEVSAKGFDREAFDFEPQAARDYGVRQVTLRPRSERRLVLHADPIKAEERVRLRLLRVGASGSPIERDITFVNGETVLDDIPTGRLRIEVSRPRTPSALWDSYIVTSLEEVDVLPRGETKKRVRIRRGGRLRVRLADRSGVHYAAKCEVVDARGRVYRPRFVVGDRGGYVRGGPGSIHDRGVNEAYSALAPGHYVVRILRAGQRAVERRVEIRTGKVSEVDVRVDR